MLQLVAAEPIGLKRGRKPTSGPSPCRANRQWHVWHDMSVPLSRIADSVKIWLAGLLIAGASLALLALVTFFMVNEVQLDLRGQRATAVVEHVVTGGKGSDVIHIRYRPITTVALVHADFQSLFGKSPRAGQRIEIDYDPGRLTRVREAGTHDPLFLVPVFIFFLVLPLWWLGADRMPAWSRPGATGIA